MQHIKKDEEVGKMFDGELEYLPGQLFREWKLEKKEENTAQNG
ncbi:hypothetical protein QUB47_03220 [Microcoleus sp. AT9_B5]